MHSGGGGGTYSGGGSTSSVGGTISGGSTSGGGTPIVLRKTGALLRCFFRAHLYCLHVFLESPFESPSTKICGTAFLSNVLCRVPPQVVMFMGEHLPCLAPAQ